MILPQTTQKIRLGVLAAGALLCVSLAPGEALAGKKVVVLSFSGPRGGAASRMVARALRRRFTVISQGQFARAASRAGTSIRATSGKVKAARVLRVAAIITGSIKRVGSRWVLRILVASGATGRNTGIATFPLRGARVDAGTSRMVPKRLRAALARARPGAPLRGVRAVSRRPRRKPRPRRVTRPRPRRPVRVAVKPAPVRRPRPAPRNTNDFDDGSAVYVDPEPVQPVRTPRRRPTALDEDEFSTPRRVEEPRMDVAPANPRVAQRTDRDDLGFEVNNNNAADTESPDNLGVRQYQSNPRVNPGGPRITRRVSTRPPWEKIVEVSLGIMLLNREFDFNDPVKPKNPSNYRSGLVPAFLGEFAFYPLSYFHRGPLANLGIEGRYFRVLYLRSQMAGQLEPLTTTLHDVEFGLRYRWNILSSPTSPTIKAGLDFGRLGFKIHDEASNPVPLPDIAYYYLKLALVGVVVPFYASSTFSIGASGNFDYLLIFSSGDIERTDSGGYGRSSTGGIEVNLGLWASYRGFFARVNGFYRRIFYDFDNACYPISGCNAAGGALDIYKGGYLSIGYAY